MLKDSCSHRFSPLQLEAPTSPRKKDTSISHSLPLLMTPFGHVFAAWPHLLPKEIPSSALSLGDRPL